ncbi:MAG: YafY family transcriptional regulator [bacterium]|nr:YafY family transcriptional regulator [bacterium]
MGMPKYDRLLYILNLLRSRKTLNAERIARECGVTERSIYRDIISLSEANIPIYYDRGYKLASDNFLPPLNFTFEEYRCLKLALESSPLARTGANASLLKQIRAKVEAGLSEPTREKKRTAKDTARIDIDTSSARRQAEKFYGPIEQAIDDQRCIEMAYETIDHGLTERIVEPCFIVFRGHAFYFVAYCRMREDFRTFRIDRVRSLVVLDKEFRPRMEIDPGDYFENSWRLYTGDLAEVAIRFHGPSARVIASGKHHPREVVECSEDGSVMYRVSVSGTDEIRRWILGFGDEAEVLSPPSLREELGRVGLDLASLYSG